MIEVSEGETNHDQQNIEPDHTAGVALRRALHVQVDCGPIFLSSSSHLGKVRRTQKNLTVTNLVIVPF